ncbi:MAG: tyrosine-type recombinase/integrase [Verrucomicrobiota bacterium]|nr:tyrosine-type recombinase/integrase [Verrucomicrobiota bacterium]
MPNKVSIKDVHSLRHTFCYLASINNISLSVVKSIVGHTSDKMTEHYQNHADRKVKRKMMEDMPTYFALPNKSVKKLSFKGQNSLEKAISLLKANPQKADEVITLLSV